MIRSDNLPKIVFIAEDASERVLVPSAARGRIRAVADYLATQVQPGSPVGLIYKSEPNLVINWLAALLAGLQPLIMQYPTKKQTRAYWADSVKNTISVAGLAAIIGDDTSVDLGLDSFVTTISQKTLDGLPDGNDDPFALEKFKIIQLSSGTTGHRKAVVFQSEDLQRHVLDFNTSLELDKSDKIISWLPLYHDMGYIACFVMPMILGVEVCMIDPMTWVRKPELLFDAIERHSSTICYMPNFGFEVMSRCAPRRLNTMRWWISCSEPVSADTARRFLEHISAPEESFAPCYAMAENVFAVTIRRGLRTRRIDAADVVSCGRPIAGVQIKIVDDEVWVCSPASLKSYLGGQDIRDPAGYYPTGDLGRIFDGELYLTGRKHDLLIQAGRKWMLSDIDLTLNRLYPEIRGRAAAVQVYDGRLGTQKPVVLIESAEFFRRRDQDDIADRLKREIGIDQIEVRFVPPRFLTKTSSGKINRRKSAEDWLLVRERGQQRLSANASGDPCVELKATFATFAWDVPVREALDSLSLTLLQIITSEVKIAFDDSLTLNEISNQLSSLPIGSSIAETTGRNGIRIVSLADSRILKRVTHEHIEQLSRKLGMPVTLEHMCMPPSPVLLSDLVFHDYFQPRLPNQEDFTAVDRAFATLRSASLVIVDDAAELHFPISQVYPVFSHRFERSPDADLLAFRWQRYVEKHQRLPVAVLAGCDLPLRGRQAALEALKKYLEIPIFRVANVKSLESYTCDWEYRPLRALSGGPGLTPLDPGDFIHALGEWCTTQRNSLKTVSVQSEIALDKTDLPHFCSHFVDRSALERVLSNFESFCIAGRPASVPYISSYLEKVGKRFSFVPSFSPQSLASAEPFECLLVCGPTSVFDVEFPVVSVMGTSWGQGVRNVSGGEIASIELRSSAAKSCAEDEWFNVGEFGAAGTPDELEAIRAATRDAARQRDERIKRRQDLHRDYRYQLGAAARVVSAGQGTAVRLGGERRPGAADLWNSNAANGRRYLRGASADSRDAGQQHLHRRKGCLEMSDTPKPDDKKTEVREQRMEARREERRQKRQEERQKQRAAERGAARGKAAAPGAGTEGKTG